MNGFAKNLLAVVCLAGGMASIGCRGGERYRNLVDPCSFERYSALARQDVVAAFTPQVQNGRILDQTIWNWHFEKGTDKLNASGQDKLDQIVRRRPEPDPRVFLATARDLTYNADMANDFADNRRDLDARRTVAIQKYLGAATAGRPMAFEVLVHDPADPGMSGVSVRNAILSQRGTYTGTIGAGSGGMGSDASGSGGTGSGGSTGGGTNSSQGGGTGGPGGAPQQ